MFEMTNFLKYSRKDGRNMDDFQNCGIYTIDVTIQAEKPCRALLRCCQTQVDSPDHRIII